MKPVTDPEILSQLESGDGTGMKPVTDPAIIAQLEGKPGKKSPEGYGGRLIEGWGKRARAIGEEIKGIPGDVFQPNVLVPQMPVPAPERLTRIAGQVAGGLFVDPITEGLKSAWEGASSLIPEGWKKGAEEAVKPTIKSLVESPVGQAVGEGISFVGKQYSQIKKDYPELVGRVEKDIEAFADLAASAPLVKPIAGGVGKLAKAGAGAVLGESTLPERLYGSAIKMPLSKKWTKLLPGEEVTARERAAAEGIKERVRGTEYGLEKARSLERETREQIDAVITSGSAAGGTIKTKEIVDAGLKNAYEAAGNSSDPVGAKKIVDRFAKKFLEEIGRASWRERV